MLLQGSKAKCTTFEITVLQNQYCEFKQNQTVSIKNKHISFIFGLIWSVYFTSLAYYYGLKSLKSNLNAPSLLVISRIGSS